MIDVAPDSNTVAKTYTWGLDLSDQLQGAGGVGGLLCVTVHSDTGDSAYYPSYDANGNISEYVDASDSVVAHYEYSPFGKITSSSGSKAGDFRHRFSTKYLDSETSLYYYGYRYYSSELGRWINRDPIGERGFAYVVQHGPDPPDIARHDPVYTFIMNDAVNNLDFLGLQGTCEYICVFSPFWGYQCSRMYKRCEPCYDCPYFIWVKGPISGPGRFFKTLIVICAPGSA